MITASSATQGLEPLKRIGILAYPGVMSLDATGPPEVFATANYHLQQRGQPPCYTPEIIAWREGLVVCSSGLRLIAEHSCKAVTGKLHSLLVAGGPDVSAQLEDVELVTWLVKSAPAITRIGSICTGAFLLAQAGLLDGRRATTHWQHSDEFRSRFPEVKLCPDIIYVRDGALITSAGVTAGMDMALALVEEDCGKAIAMATAKSLVMFLRRPGGQSQFSTLLEFRPGSSERISELIEWLFNNLDQPLNVERLAKQACMSSRHFARVFQQQTQLTPAKFINLARIERARLYLEQEQIPLKQVASQCGFGSDEQMRRAFVRHLNVLPQQYRQRFQA